MRKRLLIAAAVFTLEASACRADDGLCKALSGVAEQAARTGEPQRITMFKTEPMTISCELSHDTVRDAYCSAAIEAVGLEFHHLYPWSLSKCVRGLGSSLRMETSPPPPGLNLPRVDHLTARLQHGVRIDLRYKPQVDSGASARMREYYGQFDLVVWRPS